MRPPRARAVVPALLLVGLLVLGAALGRDPDPDPGAPAAGPPPTEATPGAPSGVARLRAEPEASGERGPGGGPSAPEAAPGQDPAAPAGTAEEATGALEGRLLTRPGALTSSNWEAHLEGPGRRWPFTRGRVDREGRFRFEGLRPGTFELWVDRDGNTQSFVGDLHVRAGEVTRDPRLFPLDLRDALDEMRIRFAPGGPQPHLARAFLDLGPHQRNRGVLEDGAHVLRAPRGTRGEVWVVARGRRPRHLPFEPGEHELTLERGLLVTLRPRRTPRAAEGVLGVWFALRPEEAPDGSWPADHQVTFEGAKLLGGQDQGVRLPYPGRYRLYSAATSQRGPGFMPLYEREASEAFDVHEHEEGAVLVLDLVEVIEADF